MKDRNIFQIELSLRQNYLAGDENIPDPNWQMGS